MKGLLEESFDRSSAEYVLARAVYPAELIESVAKRAALDTNSRVLDIGCGSGQATLDFGRRGCQVVAIDPAQNALDLLAERCKGLSNVELVRSTLEDYAGDASSFDLVTCAQAFHWLDPATASRRVSGLLKPGGHIALFWHMQDIRPGSPQADLYALNAKYFDSYPRMNPPEYAPEFLQAMADVLCRDRYVGDVELEEFRWLLGYSKEMFVALYHSWSKYVTLPESGREAVDAELVAYLDALPEEPEISYRTCCIHAKRGPDQQ